MSYFPQTSAPAYNPAGDPYLRELETLYSAQSQSERANRDEAIRRAVGTFGLVPAGLPSSATGIIDDPTRAIAQQNTASGLSTWARLQDDFNKAKRIIPDRLAATGMLFSGETGYQLGEAQKLFERAGFDATRELIDYISGALSAYAQAETGRTFSLAQERQQLRLRAEDLARETLYRQQELAMQAAANAASYGGGGGGGGESFIPESLPPEQQAPSGPTITAYEAQVMREWGQRQSTARPDWVRAIFAAHPGFLSGATQYEVI